MNDPGNEVSITSGISDPLINLQFQGITQSEKTITFQLKATNTSPELVNMGYSCPSSSARISMNNNHDLLSCFKLCSADTNCKAFALG